MKNLVKVLLCFVIVLAFAIGVSSSASAAGLERVSPGGGNVDLGGSPGNGGGEWSIPEGIFTAMFRQQVGGGGDLMVGRGQKPDCLATSPAWGLKARADGAQPPNIGTTVNKLKQASCGQCHFSKEGKEKKRK